VLGYDVIASKAAQSLRDSPDLTVVEGPPGVGKSLLAKAIGELWESGGGSVVVAEGDPLRGDVAFYPFAFAMAPLGTSWRSLGPAVAGISKAAETLIGTAGIVTALVEALASATRSRRKGRMLLLSNQEQKIMIELGRLAKRPPLLLVADNLHWWDSRSLEFLGRLRNERMREAFSFLDGVRILGVQTPEPYQSVANPSAHSALLAPLDTAWVPLPKIPLEGFQDVLVALGAPDRLPEEAVKDMYYFSGGNLALARRCTARLAQGEESFLNADDSEQEFVQRLMSERIRSLGSLGEQAVSLLEVAAIVGLRFRREELVCASDANESDTARLLRDCRDEDLLHLEDGGGWFVHEVYRQHFLASARRDKIAIHERLMDCFRQLRPADYDLRCINAIAAERPSEAAALGVQTALQAEREGRDWQELPDRILDAIRLGGLTKVAERLVEAHRQLKAYRFEACLAALDDLPNEPKSLVAEATYLRVRCLMSTRSEEDRETGRRTLGNWSSYVTDEPEMGTRLLLLSMYGLMHLADKQPGIDLEEGIKQTLLDRAEHDVAAKDALHTLDRCSGGLYSVDGALRRIKRAADYFGPDPELNLVRKPMEYYWSLVNLGSCQISNARYDDACDTHDMLADFIEEYPSGVFSRTDTPAMNRILAEFRAGRIDLMETLGRHRQLLTLPVVQNDPFYGRNAMGVYLALAGSYDEALETFERIEDELRSRLNPEPNMTYLLGSNRCLTRFVSGEQEAARAEWDEIGSIIPMLVFPSQPVYARRHQLMSEVLREAGELSALELDSVLLSNYKDEIGPLWKDYAHAFSLPAVEMWREY